MKHELKLKPTYWASVSGGKDSLLMLQIILKNPDKYPLNGVVHFELEIDFPFIKNVVDEMENMVKPLGIPFYRIKPRNSWYDLYKTRLFPSQKYRWCNGEYKMDGKKQLDNFMKSQGYSTIYYIGYCVDEVRRYENRKKPNEVYPLVIENILESDILRWAGNQPIFNDYYKYFTRCGCMYCPMLTYLEMAYILKYYPDNYNFMINAIRETEINVSAKSGKPYALKQPSNPKYNADYVDNIVRTKWLKKLEEKENEQ